MNRTPARRAADVTASAAAVERTTGQVAASRRVGVESARPPCRFFLLGKCKFGNSCTFSHDPADGRVPVCSFFERTGTCRYGDDCKFLHGPSPDDHQRRTSTIETATTTTTTTTSVGAGEAASPGRQEQHSEVDLSSPGAVKFPQAADGDGATSDTAGRVGAAEGDEERVTDMMESAGDKCGICLENIPASGKRFGLLNCDHIYCLECLRTWRKSKGPQKDISRTCPECRKVSFFLVPSKEHLKGKEKLKAIQAYKKGLSKLPCKYHKPEGSRTRGNGSSVNVCPFGARCFYAHLDENGNDVKDKTPPTASTPARRTCPYLAGRGGGGGGSTGGGRATRGSSRRGGRSGGRGGGGGDLGGGPHVLSLYDANGDLVDGWMRPLIPDRVFYEDHQQQHHHHHHVGGQQEQVSVIRRLQQLMLGTANDDF